LVQPDSLEEKNKVELLLARALTQEVDRYQIISSLFSPTLTFTPLTPDHPQLQLLEALLKKLEDTNNYSDFIEGELLSRLQQIKPQLSQLFWHPQILTIIIKIAMRIDQRLRILLEKEQEEICNICAELLKEGIKKLPAGKPHGSLDVETAHRIAKHAQELVSSSYENTFSGHRMLANIGNFLRKYQEENKPFTSCNLVTQTGEPQDN
jgi:hypothetical protein